MNITDKIWAASSRKSGLRFFLIGLALLVLLGAGMLNEEILRIVPLTLIVLSILH